MRTLADAWKWYENTRHQLRLIQRLAEHYWDDLPWQGKLSNDNYFRLADNASLVEEARFSLAHVNDLAVVVLFSVFESSVRHHVLTELEKEVPTIRHRALRLAAEKTRERIELGSFFEVLQPFKDAHADLVEEVNQVRGYRNWVAHGKRGAKPPNVEPPVAYDRLSRFLQVLSQEAGAVGIPEKGGQT